MVNTADWKPRQVCFPFTGLLFLFRLLRLQAVRLRDIQVADCLCLIKKHNLPVHFHKTDLARPCHFFTGPAKPALFGKDQLFHHQLHFII